MSWKACTSFIMAAALVLIVAGCTAVHPPEIELPPRSSITAGETVTVKPNENIYGVARDYDVPMREIIVLNDLKPPYNLRAGQQLVLPATTRATSSTMPPPVPAPRDIVEKRALEPIEPAPVTSAQLSPMSGTQKIPSVLSNINSGSVAAAPLAPPSAQSAPVEALNAPMPPPKPVPTTATAPAAVSTPQAASEPVVAPAAEAAAAPVMIWPVQGPVLSTFGPKGQGLNNDGVNIGAPKGSPVVAAAPGIVVYAGNDMKGFGNLILIRHSNGWVTAYAHLDRILVSKDAVVAQNDMIGTVGKTGNVPSPQLHFETRQEGKPVDPSSVVKS